MYQLSAIFFRKFEFIKSVYFILCTTAAYGSGYNKEIQKLITAQEFYFNF